MYKISIHSEFVMLNGSTFKVRGSFFTCAKPNVDSPTFAVSVLADYCPMLLGIEGSTASIKVYDEKKKLIKPFTFVNTMDIMRSYRPFSDGLDLPGEPYTYSQMTSSQLDFMLTQKAFKRFLHMED